MRAWSIITMLLGPYTCRGAEVVGHPSLTFGSNGTLPAAVMIMAQGRSGSTMLGDLFRSNQEFLYFYEPCRVGSRTHQLHNHDCFALLRRLLRCEFTLDDYHKIASDASAIERGSPNLRWLVSSNAGGDDPRAHEELMETCRTSRAVVAKTIRLLNGVPSPEYNTVGLNIVHLVRDPRAITASQENRKMGLWAENEGPAQTGRRICESIRKQLDSSSTLESGSKYIQIRYEDVATVPHLATAYLYCRLRLGMVPTTVSTWVEKNTRLDACQDSGTRYLATDVLEDDIAENEELRKSGPASFSWLASKRELENSACEQEKSETSPYGTRRDSASMASLWRTQTSDEFSRAVWDACEESGVLAELGYFY